MSKKDISLISEIYSLNVAKQEPEPDHTDEPLNVGDKVFLKPGAPQNKTAESIVDHEELSNKQAQGIIRDFGLNEPGVVKEIIDEDECIVQFKSPKYHVEIPVLQHLLTKVK